MDTPWIALDTQQAIDAFMHTYGYFHDGCLVELNYVSGTYVNPDLSMQPCADKRSVCILFHRQLRDPFIIEMLFEGLEILTLRPIDPHYTSEMIDARLRLKDGKIEWFNDHIDDPDDQYSAKYITWLRAERGFWRPIE